MKIEFAVAALIRSGTGRPVPPDIFHGRRVCHARKPACGACTLAATARRTGPARPTEVAAKLVKTGAQVADVAVSRRGAGRCWRCSRCWPLAGRLHRRRRRRPARAGPAVGAEAGPRLPRARPAGHRRGRAARPRAALPRRGEGTAPVPLRRLTGTPTVLNLWASWCAPCRQELPALARLHRDGAGQVRVVGVASQDRAGAAVAYAADGQLPFASLEDPDGGLRRALRRPGLPVTSSWRRRRGRGRLPGAAADRRDAAGTGPGQAGRRCRLSRPRRHRCPAGWSRWSTAGRDGRRPADFLRSAPAARPAGGRRSAVLILLGDGPAARTCCCIQRADQLRNHAGQPAFPGGAADPDDGGPEDTALREAAEEVGLDPAGVGWSPCCRSSTWRRPASLVTPVLAWWHAPAPVGAVDPAEVARVERVPVAELVDPANRCRVRHPSGYAGPAFAVRGMIVWGFTAAVLDRLLELAGWARPWDPDDVRELPQRALDLCRPRGCRPCPGAGGEPEPEDDGPAADDVLPARWLPGRRPTAGSARYGRGGEIRRGPWRSSPPDGVLLAGCGGGPTAPAPSVH